MMRQYELLERVKRYNPGADEALLNRAYVYAMKAHGNQKRASGDPYFAHPLEVAAILTELNPRLPQLREGVRNLTELADIVTRAGPELFDGLDNATTTARTLDTQQGALDAALLATMGFAGTATDTVTRGAPPLIRATSDLLATSRLLNTYSPEIFCTIRNVAELVPLALSSFATVSIATGPSNIVRENSVRRIALMA